MCVGEKKYGGKKIKASSFYDGVIAISFFLEKAMFP